MTERELDPEFVGFWMGMARFWFEKSNNEDAVWRCLLRAVSGFSDLK